MLDLMSFPCLTRESFFQMSIETRGISSLIPAFDYGERLSGQSDNDSSGIGFLGLL